jgi:hypothetical protein
MKHDGDQTLITVFEPLNSAGSESKPIQAPGSYVSWEGLDSPVGDGETPASLVWRLGGDLLSGICRVEVRRTF